MAAATTILAGSALALGAGGSMKKAIGGGKQRRAAMRAAKNFRRQELKNVHAQRQISTRGAELAQEEMARRTATSVEALRSGGIRGVVGGIGGVNQANIQQSRQIGSDLDRQQVALDREKAMDEATMRQMQENRETQELQAIQAQVNAGAQTEASGWGDLAQTGFAAASSGLFPAGGANPLTQVPTVTAGAVTGNALVDNSIIAPVFLGNG